MDVFEYERGVGQFVSLVVTMQCFGGSDEIGDINDSDNRNHLVDPRRTASSRRMSNHSQRYDWTSEVMLLGVRALTTLNTIVTNCIDSTD